MTTGQHFQSLQELIRALANHASLLNELFEKRNIRIRKEEALSLVDDKEERLAYLKQREVIRENGDFIELDERFIDFFEEVLDVNVEINNAFIRESLEALQNNIRYYIEEKSTSRKSSYLRKVKAEIRKITNSTWRNVLDLRRNIEDTYKTEPNYKIKIDKLQHYDRKRLDILELTQSTESLCFEKEKLFFTQATDEELNRIKRELRLIFNDARHQLIEIEKQIIEYLNQARSRSALIEKLHKVKFLKDRFELKQKSNVEAVVRQMGALLLEPKQPAQVKVSLNDLQADETIELVKKARQNVQLKKQLQRKPAGEFHADELEAEKGEEVFVNYEAMRNSFLASGRDLMDFINQYPLPGNPDFGEQLTIYCRMIALFPQDIEITDRFKSSRGVEYALAFPVEVTRKSIQSNDL